MFKPLTRIAAACALLFSQTTHAASLQDVLRKSLKNDPELLEAQANKQAADSDIQIAKSGHVPTLTLTATQVLAQKHRYDSQKRAKGISPGLQGKLNLYSFGGVDSRVRYSEHKYDYFHHKYYETQELVGQNIGKLYLGALRAKEAIQAAQNNLQRHDQIIGDLKIITQYDKGRQSELDQAMARRLRVQAYLAEQARVLELNLSRLGKYTQMRLNPAALQDPFAGETVISIMRRYQSEDLANQPSYQAQQAERESVLAEIDINKASRFPTIDLIASASRDNKEIYVNFGWDFLNPTANYQVERSAQTLIAAEAKSDQILREVSERTRSAEVSMKQSLNRNHIAEQQIAAQKKVIKAYELQFKIARRTLIDVLDSYSDLWNIEAELLASRNDFRDAALEYLSSQAAIARWAGLNQDRSAPVRPERKTFRDHLPDNFLPKNIQKRLDSFLISDKDKDQVVVPTDPIVKDGEPALDYNQVTQDNVSINMPAVTPNSKIQTEPVLSYQQINHETNIAEPPTEVPTEVNVSQPQPVLYYNDIVSEQPAVASAETEKVYQPKSKIVVKKLNKNIKVINTPMGLTKQPKKRTAQPNQATQPAKKTAKPHSRVVRAGVSARPANAVQAASGVRFKVATTPKRDKQIVSIKQPERVNVPKRTNANTSPNQDRADEWTRRQPETAVELYNQPMEQQLPQVEAPMPAQQKKVELIDAPEHGIVWNQQPAVRQKTVMLPEKAQAAKTDANNKLKQGKEAIKQGKKQLKPSINQSQPQPVSSETSKHKHNRKNVQKQSSLHTHWVLEARVPYQV